MQHTVREHDEAVFRKARGHVSISVVDDNRIRRENLRQQPSPTLPDASLESPRPMTRRAW